MYDDREIDKKIEELNQELKNDPNDFNINLSLGVKYFEKKDWSNAIKCWEKTILLKPNSSKPYLLLGILYNNIKEYDKAIKYLNKAIDIDSNDSDVYLFLGKTYGQIGEYDIAIEKFEKAIELNPQNSRGYCFLGSVYGLNEEYDKAIKYFEKAIEKNSKDFESYRALGCVYSIREEYDKAIKYFEKAIEKNPKDCDAYYFLGLTLVYKGKNDTAIEKLKKAIEINPNCSDAYDSLVKIYLKNREYDKAFELSLENADTLINGFAKRLNNIFKTEKEIPLEYKSILFKVYELLKLLQINFKEKNKDIFLYQYRKFNFLEIVLKNKNFWLNPTDYQNDPNEGKAFFRYIDFEDKEISTDLVAFISCFSALEDNLIMWNSSYAQDGEGISIGVNFTKLSVGTDMLAGINIMSFSKEINIEESSTKKQVIEKEPISMTQIGLYKILYINSEGKYSENDANKDAKDLLREIKILYTKIKEDNFYKKEKQKIDNWLNDLFTLVRYLIKFDDYEHEKEYRLLYIANIRNNKYVKSEGCLNGIHVETEKVLFRDKEKKDIIFVGPKSNSKFNMLKINHYLKCNDIDKYIEVKPSDIEFR